MEIKGSKMCNIIVDRSRIGCSVQGSEGNYFVLQLLESFEIKVELPIIVRVDNVGAIFMSGNKTTTSRANHVDIRTKYVNEYCEDGKIKIIFVKSVDNDSDICTKNLGGDLFEKHSMKLVKMYE